jgi:hypothetical protein
MANKQFDLKKISVSFTGIGVSIALGTRTVKNWGADKANLLDIVPQQPEANKVILGADGSSMTLRQYDTATMKLTIKVFADTDDDKYFKSIMALHQAGSETVFAITYNDENTGEILATVAGSLGTLPNLVRGTEMDGNRTYIFNMPECLYTPPTA